MKRSIKSLSLCSPIVGAILVLGIAGFYFPSVVIRGIAAILSLCLLTLEYFLLKNNFSSRARLYVIPVLLVPSLAAVWFGLNQLRVYYYDPPESTRYYVVTQVQEVIVWIAGLLLLILTVAFICEIARLIVGKKQDAKAG